MSDTFLKVGDKVPKFLLQDPEENNRDLSSYGDGWKIVYFYPKDNTKGCTTEAIDFSENLDEIKSLGTEVIGISPDTVKKHNSFIEKHSLKVNLLSDPEKEMLEKFGVWQLKKMYGKEYMGVVRTTYLIDEKDIIQYVWSKVRVKDHVSNVIDKLKELKGQ